MTEGGLIVEQLISVVSFYCMNNKNNKKINMKYLLVFIFKKTKLL
jgi:hypothetical protein